MEFAIEPHRGIGPISFGMSRKEVSTALARVGGGRPDARNEQTDCYFGTAFQVSFGDGGKADFIEVASSFDAVVLLNGLDVFDTPARRLLAFVNRLDQAAPELSEPPNSYIFPGIILSLWGRDKQYEHRGGQKRPVFAAVGVGAESYLTAIRAICAG
ncbi:MAG: hypothetical protein WCD18_06070 [Thermosynechococcaceae cyanobacterium]